MYCYASSHAIAISSADSRTDSIAYGITECFAALLSPMKRNGGEVQPFSHADLVTSVCPVRSSPSAL